MSVDEARGLVFLPTTSPSPDFWGGLRPGDDGNANSVVALKVETGEVAWAFKTVHHDVWDYDNPAQPTLGHGGLQGRDRTPRCCSRPSRGCSSRSTATPASR